MDFLKIAIHQFNPIVGDIDGNINKILAAIQTAKDDGCDLFITSELAVSGYFPEDLLFNDSFHAQIKVAINKLLNISGITIICGVPYKVLNKVNDKQAKHSNHTNTNIYNSAIVIKDGQIINRYDKQMLPNYGVFDEKRYFTGGDKTLVFSCNGINVGVLICEDMWHLEPVISAHENGADILCVLNASPYVVNKYEQRIELAKQGCKAANTPLIYVNQVGGQDELVFDGASFILDRNGELCAQLNTFTEEIRCFNLCLNNASEQFIPTDTTLINYPDRLEHIYRALTLSLYDYVHKNGFKGVTIGLSGGIDSALTLAIAVDALGPDRVFPVFMPSRYTTDISLIDANDMMQRLKVKETSIEIEPLFKQFQLDLSNVFNNFETNPSKSVADLVNNVPTQDVTYENLQARIRGTLLMAISNKLGLLVVTTGNKSEMATGYATLYGDMAGGFAVLKDVNKTLVYELSNFRNTISAIIPSRIITRPPTAELRDNQVDQDSLPDYAILDQIMTCLVEENMTIDEVVDMGCDRETVNKIAKLLKSSEYKRRQAAVGPKITKRVFGRDWRYPITNKFSDI